MSGLLWTAFVLGVAGSLHCIGMCGPLMMALPDTGHGRWKFFRGRLIYNLGRIMSYAMIGCVAGVAGQGIAMAGYQQALTIVTGLAIIFMVLVPKKWISNFSVLGNSGLGKSVKQAFSKVLKQQKGVKLMFWAGLLNGFLPCGLVYAALAGAILSGDILYGMAYMALFGLGTTPLLLVFMISKKIWGPWLKKAPAKLVPAFTIVIALVFILRGLNLGIPYISPKIMADEKGQTEYKCH
jgi:uncharacterized protein